MAVEQLAPVFVALVRESTRLHAKGTLRIPQFTFECGATLPFVDVAFETWGQLNTSRDNAVVVCHALTGDAHVGEGDGRDGWWSTLLQECGILSPASHFVIASNVLGGCAGSSGPGQLALDGRPYALRFPVVTVRDMVRAQVCLIDAFQISSVQTVIGGSLGGMQAWEWPLTAPGRVKRVIVIAAHAAFSALGIGYNEAMRQAIVSDPHWQHGSYYETAFRPELGLSIARSIGMLTYRSHRLYEERFARKPMDGKPQPESDGEQAFTSPQYEVEGYLRHHGQKLNQRFDANSYLYLTRAMDSHDIGRQRGGVERALSRYGAHLTVIGIDSDYLYNVESLQQDVRLARRAGVTAQYLELSSIHGHDAFLIDQSHLSQLLLHSGTGTPQRLC